MSEQKTIDLGYPHVEKLLESEDFNAVNQSFNEAFKKLESTFNDSSAGLKKQKAAQKAMKAYELTTGLMNELLQIKYEIKKARKNEKKSK